MMAKQPAEGDLHVVSKLKVEEFRMGDFVIRLADKGTEVAAEYGVDPFTQSNTVSKTHIRKTVLPALRRLVTFLEKCSRSSKR